MRGPEKETSRYLDYEVGGGGPKEMEVSVGADRRRRVGHKTEGRVGGRRKEGGKRDLG